MQSVPPRERNTVIVQELKRLNEKLALQNSTRHIFFTGVIYGVGFFIGSAILATLALGVLGPWVGRIDWVKDVYERGIEIYKGA